MGPYHRASDERLCHNIVMASIALRDGDWSKGHCILFDALENAEESANAGAVSYIYDKLASIAYKMGDFTMAEELLVRAIDSVILLGTSDEDNVVIKFVLKLCRILANQGQDDLVELGLRHCVAAQRKKVADGPEDEETRLLSAIALFWFGKFLARKSRHDEAKGCFEECLAQCDTSRRVDEAQRMVVLFCLAQACRAAGQCAAAQRHLLEAIALGQAKSHPDLPLFYVELGRVYLQLGVTREALQHCEQGRALAVKAGSEDVQRKANKCLNDLKRISCA